MRILLGLLLIGLIILVLYSADNFRTLENFQLIEIKNSNITDKGICCFGNQNEITNLNQCENKIVPGSTCNRSQEDCYKCTGKNTGWFPFVNNYGSNSGSGGGCGCSLCINSFGCGGSIIPPFPTPTPPFPTPTPPFPTPTPPFPTPTPIEPVPTPTPIDPVPTPTPIDPVPTPTPIDPVPTPTPIDPVPTPTPIDPVPTPTPKPPTPKPPTPKPPTPNPPTPTPKPPTPNPPAPPTPVTPMPVDGWFGSQKRVKSTHYWDCSGQSCDACQSQIKWNNKALGYKTPVNYAPVDPKTLGGSKYGEVLWMTGAVDKPVALALKNANVKGLKVSGNCPGNNDCNSGCGKCALVKKLSDKTDNNILLVMQRNIIGNNCPNPGGHASGWPGGQWDLNSPGLDCNPNSPWCPSLANTCGSTLSGLSAASGHSVADAKGTQARLEACKRLKEPDGSSADPKMIEGCKLFIEYADKVGGIGGEDPLLYKPVDCPDNYINYIKSGIEGHNWGR